MEFVYISIISGIFTLLGIILWQRGSITNWALRMDYKNQEYNYKQNIEKIRSKRALEKELLKYKGRKPGNILNQLADLDLDKIGEIIEQVGDLKEGTEEGGLMGILKNPVIQGIMQGISTGKDKEKEEENDNSMVWEK